MNEFLMVLTLLFTFGCILVWYGVSGPHGMYAITAFITVVANIEVVILVDAFGLEMTLGNMLFAGTFLATDILSEMHGEKAASRCVKIGILTSVSMVMLTNIWVRYIPSPNDFVHPAIVTVFSNTPRIMLSSLVVYAICQVVDVKLYHLIWKLTGGTERFMWLRNNGATVASQTLNAILFNAFAFWGVVPATTLVSIITANILITVITSLLDTPVLYVARAIAKHKEYGRYK